MINPDSFCRIKKCSASDIVVFSHVHVLIIGLPPGWVAGMFVIGFPLKVHIPFLELVRMI